MKAQGGDISGFKYMKACCENHGEQMFSVFTKDKTKQGVPLPFSPRHFKWEFRETILTENVWTWDYFNKGIQGVDFWIIYGKCRNTLELMSNLDDFLWFDFAC